MNTIIQNILVFTALVVAILFLVKKFIGRSKKKPIKACGKNDCGHH